MSKIQEMNGQYTVTVPHRIVKAKHWDRGSELEFLIVDEFNRPLPGDIFLRRTR